MPITQLMLPNWSSPRSPPSLMYSANTFPWSISSHEPDMRCTAYIGDESGSHDVPDPSRIIGRPSGPVIISIIASCIGAPRFLMVSGAIRIEVSRFIAVSRGIRPGGRTWENNPAGELHTNTNRTINTRMADDPLGRGRVLRRSDDVQFSSLYAA